MIDQYIIIIYLSLTIFIGLWSGRKTNNVKEFTSASKSYSTPVITATIIATLIGGGHIVGMATKAYSIGIIYVLAIITKIVIGKFFTAIYLSSRITKYSNSTTVGELIGSFYGKQAKLFVGILGSLFSVGIVASQILAMSSFISVVMQIPLNVAIIMTGLIIITYSAFGGIRSVTATDILQFYIMVFAIPILCYFAIQHVGGIKIFVDNLPAKNMAILNHPDFNKYLTLALLCTPVMSPPSVQRYLMAKNEKQIKYSLFTAIILEPPYALMFAIIGLTAIILFPNIDANKALPTVISNILPVGIKGIGVVAVLSITMSSADSYLNSSSILFTNDFVRNITTITEQTQLKLMIIMTFVIGGLAICMALYKQDIIEIIVLTASLWNATVSMPLILGLFGTKSNYRNFLIAAIAGSTTFVISYILDLGYIGYIGSIFANTITLITLISINKTRCE